MTGSVSRSVYSHLRGQGVHGFRASGRTASHRCCA